MSLNQMGIWKCLVYLSVVSLISCHEDSPTPIVDWGEPATYGEFITDACDVGIGNFEETRWEHAETSVLHLEKAEGCAVYQGSIEFTPNPEFHQLATWQVRTRMCNRCQSPRYLRWLRYRAHQERDDQIELPDGDLLSFGVDLDGVPGPELGDGLSGFIRYEDSRGGEYLTQCWFRYPYTNEYDAQTIVGPLVFQRVLQPGEWVRTEVGWHARMLFDTVTNGQGEGETYQRVDFSRLEKVSYLWPKMHSAPSDRVGEFPLSECRKLDFDQYYHNPYISPPIGGELDPDRGYEDWIPQEFDFQLPEPFHSQLFGLNEAWIAGQESDRDR